jgi:hypothetical protein
MMRNLRVVPTPVLEIIPSSESMQVAPSSVYLLPIARLTNSSPCNVTLGGEFTMRVVCVLTAVPTTASQDSTNAYELLLLTSALRLATL